MSVLRELLEARVRELERDDPNRILDDAVRTAALEECLARPADDPKRLEVEALLAQVSGRSAQKLTAKTLEDSGRLSPGRQPSQHSDCNETLQAAAQSVTTPTSEPATPSGYHLGSVRGVTMDIPNPVGWNNHAPDPKPQSAGPFTEQQLWDMHLANHGGSRRRALQSWRRPTPSSSVIYPDWGVRVVPPFRE